MAARAPRHPREAAARALAAAPRSSAVRSTPQPARCSPAPASAARRYRRPGPAAAEPPAKTADSCRARGSRHAQRLPADFRLRARKPSGRRGARGVVSSRRAGWRCRNRQASASRMTSVASVSAGVGPRRSPTAATSGSACAAIRSRSRRTICRRARTELCPQAACARRARRTWSCTAIVAGGRTSGAVCPGRQPSFGDRGPNS